MITRLQFSLGQNTYKLKDGSGGELCTEYNRKTGGSRVISKQTIERYLIELLRRHNLKAFIKN